MALNRDLCCSCYNALLMLLMLKNCPCVRMLSSCCSSWHFRFIHVEVRAGEMLAHAVFLPKRWQLVWSAILPSEILWEHLCFERHLVARNRDADTSLVEAFVKVTCIKSRISFPKWIPRELHRNELVVHPWSFSRPLHYLPSSYSNTDTIPQQCLTKYTANSMICML